MIRLSLVFEKRDRKKRKRQKWHHSDGEMSVSSVDAGVCFLSDDVLSLYVTLKEDTHKKLLVSPVHEGGLCAFL